MSELAADIPVPARLTRDQRRSGRRHAVRAHTEPLRRLPLRERAAMRAEGLAVFDYKRPSCRAECQNDARPCPWVSCRYNLFLDVAPAGNLKINFPDIAPEAMQYSCALDIADAGANQLEVVAAVMNVTRERVRQIEIRAFRRLLDRHGEGLVLLKRETIESSADVADQTFQPESEPVDDVDEDELDSWAEERGEQIKEVRVATEPTATCSKDGCSRPAKAGRDGLCGPHYRGACRTGKALGPRGSTGSVRAAAPARSARQPRRKQEQPDELQAMLARASEAVAICDRIGWDLARSLAERLSA